MYRTYYSKIGLIFIAMCAISLPGKAQLELNDTLSLIGVSDSSRTISNIGTSNTIDNAVDAESVANSRLIYAQSMGSSNTIDLSLTPTLTQYKVGQRINFFSPIDLTDSSVISVDGLNYIPLVHPDGRNIDSLEIVSGLAVSVIYNGSAFVLLSRTAKKCPSGFVSVNDYFCIEIDENPVATFWDANVDCGDRNARLCSWSEWYLACEKLSSVMQNMTNNQEYVDSSQNYSNSITSSCWAKQVGDGDCQSNERSDPYNLRNYRCCINK